ncbi:MAG: hypothetical protein HYV09_21845 [Deltaproteobacteria bacterium]|nr:hypothetical protein [Deltaproteobacteria bacterium]
MTKFLTLSARIGVNAAAAKLFSQKPSEAEAALLLEHRGALTLDTLLKWHATHDDRAPMREVTELLRRDGVAGWMIFEFYLPRLPPDRVREWLAECGGTAPDGFWISAAQRVASPIGRKIAAVIGAQRADELPLPPKDDRLRRLLVERDRDAELVAVLVEWLRTHDDARRCAYLHQLARAGVLDAIPDVVSLLPTRVVPAWPPSVDADEAPLANVAHRLALFMPESHRHAADNWIVEQYLSAVRGGASWSDLFWRIHPRLRARIALASLELEPDQWSPFAGVALAQRIAAGDPDAWPLAMRWLEHVWDDRPQPRRPDGLHEWMETELKFKRWLLRVEQCHGSADWDALPPRAQCQVGPLFAATAADGADDKHLFEPILAGIRALEGVPLPPDEAVDRTWADLYAKDDFGLQRLLQRFDGPLVLHRAELLLEHARRTDLRRLAPVLDEVVRLTGHVPLDEAPDGQELLCCELDVLRMWSRAAGPAFGERIDARIHHRVATDPSPATLHEARALARPLRDDWKRAWRAALRTWPLAEILRYRHEEPWLANDDELVGLCQIRFAEEGERVFHARDLPECLRPVIEGNVTTLEDDPLAGELLTWLARLDPKGTDARALQRLRVRPGRGCCAWWARRLSSTQQWNDHGADVFGALLAAGELDLAWQVIDGSCRTYRQRAATQANDKKSGSNGRPRKALDESKFVAAVHFALATAMCREMTRAIEEKRSCDIERLTNAMTVLEPPPRISPVLEGVIRTLRQADMSPSAVEALEELKGIIRAGDPEADYRDLLLSLRIMAGNAEGL